MQTNFLRTILLTAFLLVNVLLRAQSCQECRFSSYVFDSIEISTVQFGEGVNADGNLQQLYMDVYEPYGDTMALRPVVFFAFGGGFVQGSRDEGYVVRACERFARAGYVACAIDYRIGFDPLGLFPVPSDELARVFFRAMQDMRGAVQWGRAHADMMGNTYRMDTNRMVIGGASAGGITACMVAYCDKVTEFEDMADTSAISSLGGFNSSSGLYPGYSWETEGVFNIAGAIVEIDWIEAGDQPIFSAHGDQDQVVPYQGGNFGIGPVTLGLEGSANIHQAALNIGVCSHLYTMEGEGHPSGGESEAFYDEIFNRAMPMAWGALQGYDLCCALEVEVIEDTISIMPGPSYTAYVSNGTNPSVQWCDLYCASSGTGPQFSYYPDSVPTALFALVTDGGCMATDFLNISTLVSQPEPAPEQGRLEMFPTPVKSSLFLRWEQNGKIEPEMIRLFDTRGRLLNQWRWNKGEVQDLDMTRYDSGVYYIEVEGYGKAYREKILLVTDN